jgi:hypothetical protein
MVAWFEGGLHRLESDEFAMELLDGSLSRYPFLEAHDRVGRLSLSDKKALGLSVSSRDLQSP